MSCKEILEDFIFVCLITVILFSPLIILLCIITSIVLLCIYKQFWYLFIVVGISCLYVCWVYYDHHTESRGGRPSERFRKFCLWKSFTRYFPLKLVKTEDLDSNRNYIFAYHPHGVLPWGAAGNFFTDATHFSNLFLNIRPHLMSLRSNFFAPVIRELYLSLGGCSVSKESINYLLSGQQGQGHAVVIVTGGIREQRLTKNDTMILCLKNRKGFIKLALENGASLVPVIGFGENELYRRCGCFNLIRNGIPWGRFIFGYIPLRHPVTTVVGKAIHVNKTVNATSEDVDRLHRDYIEAVEQLFEHNKGKYGLGHVDLEIV